jgi:hypothetical protein
MKRLSVVLWLAFLSLAISSCSSASHAGAGSPTPDQGPRVSFSTPAAGATVPLGPVQVLLLSEDPLGTAQVEVLVNGESAAMIQSPDSTRSAVVIEYSWQPPALGKYVLQAHGQNTAGIWGAFVSLELTVVDSGAAVPRGTLTPPESATETPTAIIPTATGTETPLMVTTAPPTATHSGISLVWSFSYLRMYPNGGGCEPRQNGVIVIVSGIDKNEIGSVMIFFRPKKKDTDDLGTWSKALNLELLESGAYGRGFTSAHIANPIPFLPAIILHQFAISDKSKAIIYRSPVYQELFLATCE